MAHFDISWDDGRIDATRMLYVRSNYDGGFMIICFDERVGRLAFLKGFRVGSRRQRWARYDLNYDEMLEMVGFCRLVCPGVYLADGEYGTGLGRALRAALGGRI